MGVYPPEIARITDFIPLCICAIMLDEKDLAILGILRNDSRRSTKAIAAELDMPRATVHERIKRMVEKGVIRGFTVKLDHAKMGKPITAFILISFLPEPTISQRNLAQDIATMEGVQEVHLISGEYDILAKVRGDFNGEHWFLGDRSDPNAPRCGKDFDLFLIRGGKG